MNSENHQDVEAMTGGEAIVATLKLVGIDTIFGIPGVHTGGFYDAIYAAPSLGLRKDAW